MAKHRTVNGWTKESMKAHIVDNFKGKSIGDSGDDEICLYRGHDGKKCAVGMFIPDEKYTFAMEGVTSCAVIQLHHLDSYMPLAFDGLQELQNTHDYSLPDSTLERMLNWIDKNVEDSNV